jgi:2-C-methyl-D-erythritol 4-phosphate cytidylyltransferase
MQLAKVSALIVSAGQGKRMGGRISKQYLEVAGRPLLAYTLEKFQAHPLIEDIVVVTREEERAYCRQEIIEKYRFTKVSKIVSGGKERQDSVYRGLLALPEDTEWVAVHDGVRPLVSLEVITRVVEAALTKGAAIVGVPAKDTIKVVTSEQMVLETPPRQTLWHIQTPQVFKKELLVRAYEEALASSWAGTDDASLVERLGVPIFVVQGEYDNLKITTPEDLVYFKEMLELKGD